MSKNLRMNIRTYSQWGNGTITNTNNILGPFYLNIRIFVLISDFLLHTFLTSLVFALLPFLLSTLVTSLLRAPFLTAHLSSLHTACQSSTFTSCFLTFPTVYLFFTYLMPALLPYLKPTCQTKLFAA